MRCNPTEAFATPQNARKHVHRVPLSYGERPARPLFPPAFADVGLDDGLTVESA